MTLEPSSVQGNQGLAVGTEDTFSGTNTEYIAPIEAGDAKVSGKACVWRITVS